MESILSESILSESILSESILSAIDDNDNREIYTEFITVILKQYLISFGPISFGPLEKTLPYSEVETLAFQLTLQLQLLEARGFSLLFWQPSDILHIRSQPIRSETIRSQPIRSEPIRSEPIRSEPIRSEPIRSENINLYILSNLSQLVPLDKKDRKQLVLIYPTVYPLPSECCAPELLKITALPFLTQRSASYYSLALLCLKRLNLSLDKIEGTKLFYFLERCLKEEPSERVLMYF
jgi:hypothetical protein